MNCKILPTNISNNKPPWGYDFVPYQYGCYSFQLDKDIEDVLQSEFIKIMNNKIKLITQNPIV